MIHDPRNISVEEFDYELPQENIAMQPTSQREASKLLYYKKGRIDHLKFENIPNILPEHCSLWLNETRVVRARLWFKKPTGKIIEVFCLGPDSRSGDVQQALAEREEVYWECYVKGAKKWPDTLVLTSFLDFNGNQIEVRAKQDCRKGDAFIIHFDWDHGLTFGEVLEHMGGIPLPPYIKREEEELDEERYQTVYAKNQGSVAAPTAGLHFSDDILQQIVSNGNNVKYLTLHVGAGTFKPVNSSTMEGHHMHAEEFLLSKQLIDSLLHDKGKRIAVGTTTCRTLESIYWFGVKALNGDLDSTNLLMDQWYAYEDHVNLPTPDESINALRSWLEENAKDEMVMKTELLCAPGYEFKMIQGLVTNFHMPKSTLILLVAALIGDDWRKAYEGALSAGYRFLSYGDSSLLIP